MKANIIFETSRDEQFSCYMKESVPDFALFGYGKSAEEARADMLVAYNEIKAELEKEGKTPVELEFVWHEDNTFI